MWKSTQRGITGSVARHAELDRRSDLDRDGGRDRPYDEGTPVKRPEETQGHSVVIAVLGSFAAVIGGMLGVGIFEPTCTSHWR